MVLLHKPLPQGLRESLKVGCPALANRIFEAVENLGELFTQGLGGRRPRGHRVTKVDKVLINKNKKIIIIKKIIIK